MVQGRKGCDKLYLGALAPRRNPPKCGEAGLGLHPNKKGDKSVLIVWTVTHPPAWSAGAWSDCTKKCGGEEGGSNNS